MKELYPMLKRLTRTWGLIAGVSALLAIPTAGTAATLATDKDDYAPGETVYFLGAGFQAGEAVAITLAVHTFEGIVIDYAVGGVYADADGNIAATWLVPQEALDTTIEATAIGDQSALVAVATFTDHNPAPTISLSAFSISASGNTVTFSVNVTITANPAGHTIGAVDAISPLLGNVSLTRPGGNGEGTWSGSKEGLCGTTYVFDKVLVRVDSSSQSTHNFNNQSASGASATTDDCPPEINCPEPNQAPTISASDYFPTDSCATWNGTALTVTVPVTSDNFSPITSDPEDDPVSIALDVTEVTLTGLGWVEATVTLSATDDPTARNVEGCTELNPLTATTTAKVKANLTFDFSGFAAPLDGTKIGKTIKKGQTVPVKFQLFDCAGTEIKQLTTPPTIAVCPSTGIITDGSYAILDSGASNDNGDCFRYGDGTWIYNLSTKAEGFKVNNSYKVSAELPDGTSHPVSITIGK